MPNRHTDKERWEIYLTMILLRMRPFIFIGALILLFYGVAALSAYLVVSVIAFGLALLLLLMVVYDWAIIYVARFGAWLVTLGKSNS
jgi:hypothetical protein